MIISKEDLQGKNYEWVPEEKMTVDFLKNGPSRRLFNRYNGNQLLYMINYFSETYGPLSINEGVKIEAMLQDHLPLGIKSERSVFNWLVESYTKPVI